MASGQLFIVASPIGNLEDLTARALRVLRNVQVIAAEDTRHTRKLLTHFEISKPLVRCDEYQQKRSVEHLLNLLRDGQSVAFLTDAGTPGIADPGARLVEEAAKAGIAVTPIPGPSAITAAISVCGFPVTEYRFYGFLPRKGGDRTRRLRAMTEESMASVFFESPFRVAKTIGELAALTPTRWACVAREISKTYETIHRAPLSELHELLLKSKPRGEFTVVVAPLTRLETRQARKARSTMEDE